jgi:isoleucyl-tRNA synthetase
VGSDYSEDMRIGPEILKHHTDIYRRLRNTLRYILGNLHGFNENERLDYSEMPELERWVLHRIAELDVFLRQTCQNFEFHPLFNEFHNFCAVELSSFYFDIRKDALYCERVDSIKRRAVRTVLDELFNCLTAWLAPFICFTAEEAWLTRFPSEIESVHFRLFPDIPENWQDDALAAKWQNIRLLRRVVTGALEIERAEKRIGSSLQAHPTVYTVKNYFDVVEDLDLAEIVITSDVTMSMDPQPSNAFFIDGVEDIGVVSNTATGNKCERCYKVLPEVGTLLGYDTLCGRCADAVVNYQSILV